MTLSPHLLAILSGSVRIAHAHPVAPVRDRAPVFEPSQGAHHRARFLELPELESHDAPMLQDNNTDFMSFSCND
jgi:hypothetical protein